MGAGFIRQRWEGDGGFKQLLNVAFPLILSTGSHSIMMFVDRMFLSWYSADSIAAAIPASMLSFSFLCFFLGLVMYTSTFVAQYMGARRPERVGVAVWHGIRLATVGGFSVPLLNIVAPSLFSWVGHDPSVQVLEVSYFRIMNFAAMFFLINSAFSCFFSGRGKTWPVMWMSVFMCVVNGFLDYALVFGNWGAPRLGIVGAGLGTLFAGIMATCIYAFLVCRPVHDHVYATRRGWRFERALFLRMLRFGAPSGVQFWLSITGFTVFILLVGRIGKLELVASNVAQQINILGILPMVGLGIATTILVGRFQGAQRSDVAVRVTKSALTLSVSYALFMGMLYLSIPHLLIAPFTAGDLGLGLERVAEISTRILRIMAVIALLDATNIIVGGTLRGAGDTRFVMITMGLSAAVVLVLPAYVVIEVLALSITWAWAVVIVYLAVVAFVFLSRFQSGRWKTIRVIERAEREESEGSEPVL